ncbi:MAG: hypothetical protein ACXACY_19100, partial [Candidatus Hodarchaeales archaeon]
NSAYKEPEVPKLLRNFKIKDIARSYMWSRMRNLDFLVVEQKRAIDYNLSHAFRLRAETIGVVNLFGLACEEISMLADHEIEPGKFKK